MCQAKICLRLGYITVSLVESLTSSLYDEISWHNDTKIKNIYFCAGEAGITLCVCILLQSELVAI